MQSLTNYLRESSSYYSLNTVSMSEDSSLLSGGFEDSSVRVWSLTPKKLRMLKSPSELAQIDKEAGQLKLNNNVMSLKCKKCLK